MKNQLKLLLTWKTNQNKTEEIFLVLEYLLV